MSSQQELQLNFKDELCEQQNDANPSVAKNDVPPRYDPGPGLTKPIGDSSHKLLNDLKASAEEQRGDAEPIDRDEWTPKNATGVPAFSGYAPEPSSADGFTHISNVVREEGTGKTSYGDDDSEPPASRRGTKTSGKGSNETMHSGQDAPESSYKCFPGVILENIECHGNIIVPKNLEKGYSGKDTFDPIDTKTRRWYQWWCCKK